MIDSEIIMTLFVIVSGFISLYYYHQNSQLMEANEGLTDFIKHLVFTNKMLYDKLPEESKQEFKVLEVEFKQE